MRLAKSFVKLTPGSVCSTRKMFSPAPATLRTCERRTSIVDGGTVDPRRITRDRDVLVGEARHLQRDVEHGAPIGFELDVIETGGFESAAWTLTRYSSGWSADNR